MSQESILDMIINMDQFYRYSFRIQDWLRHLSYLPFDFEFSVDQSLNFPTFIDRIAIKVRSLELHKAVLERAISNESEEDDFSSIIRRSTTFVIFLILFSFIYFNKYFYDSKKTSLSQMLNQNNKNNSNHNFVFL
jgi:hypothetical protein